MACGCSVLSCRAGVIAPPALQILDWWPFDQQLGELDALDRPFLQGGQLERVAMAALPRTTATTRNGRSWARNSARLDSQPPSPGRCRRSRPSAWPLSPDAKHKRRAHLLCSRTEVERLPPILDCGPLRPRSGSTRHEPPRDVPRAEPRRPTSNLLLVGSRMKDQVARRLEALRAPARRSRQRSPDLSLFMSSTAAPDPRPTSPDRIDPPLRRIREHRVGVREKNHPWAVPTARNP